MVYTGAIFTIYGAAASVIAMRISGHKTRSVFDRDNIISQNDIAQAGRKVGIFHHQKVVHNLFTKSEVRSSGVLQ